MARGRLWWLVVGRRGSYVVLDLTPFFTNLIRRKAGESCVSINKGFAIANNCGFQTIVYLIQLTTALVTQKHTVLRHYVKRYLLIQRSSLFQVAEV